MVIASVIINCSEIKLELITVTSHPAQPSTPMVLMTEITHVIIGSTTQYSLRKMADKRPTKPASLWRSLKSFLGVGATEEAAEVALARLIEAGVVKVDSVKGASYPMFDAATGSTVSKV